MHRAVILLGLLLAASGALLGALGGLPVVAASLVIAGALVVIAGLWLRRRTSTEMAPATQAATPAAQPESPASQPEAPAALPVEPAVQLLDEAPAAPRLPRDDREERLRLERAALREAEIAREAELNAIADGLRALRSRDLSSTHIPEWRARIETWIDTDIKARVERGEEIPPQAAEWMRDFGEIPVKDWRRHLLRHLRRLGYRNYHEGEW